MYFTIYKITNKINGKIYIGKHQTKNLDDGYMGSGKLIVRAIEKHGIENFDKEILYIFDNEDDMNAKEKELVSAEFVKEDTNYNLCPGGHGGFGYINANDDRYLTEKRLAALNLGTDVFYQRYQEDEAFRNIHKNHLRTIGKKGSKKIQELYPNGVFFGKTHTEETKKKIGLSNSKHQTGKGNSQYGTVWITNGSENKKINKSDNIPDGWYKGRVMK
jgi:group I intron endonuclease